MTQKTTVRFPQVKIVLRFGKLKLMTNRSKLQYRANFGKILIFPELRTRPSFLRPRQKIFKIFLALFTDVATILEQYSKILLLFLARQELIELGAFVSPYIHRRIMFFRHIIC